MFVRPDNGGGGRHYRVVSGQLHTPADLFPGKNLPSAPTEYETEWAPKLVWTLGKTHPLTPNSHYSNYAFQNQLSELGSIW
jgi:hypothetical protein